MVKLHDPVRSSTPVAVEGTRVRFEAAELKVTRARVQASFDAHLEHGQVAWRAHQPLPAADYQLLDVKGPAPYQYAAYVQAASPRDPERFYVTRGGGRLGESMELAGPFSTLPFTPVPVESGTPPAALLSALDLRPTERGQRPKRPTLPTFPQLPQLVGAGRAEVPAAIMGLFRGFTPTHGGGLVAG